jgi:LysM repeat protein
MRENSGFPRFRLAVRIATVLAVGLSAFALSEGVYAQSLRGSQVSMDRQERQATAHDFTYLRNSSQVRRFVDAGYIVPVRGNANYRLKGVSFPYARPELRLFIERLSAQYRSACGEQLVVTSLTRPLSSQPRNASARSVHPTGMAVDMRRSNSRACRSWIERVLLSLEEQGVLEATREQRPPHYHVALFPQPYARYVDQLASRPATAGSVDDEVRYQVRRGDSLWTIARAHGTTVDQIRAANELPGSRIYAGQTLRVPVGR